MVKARANPNPNSNPNPRQYVIYSNDLATTVTKVCHTTTPQCPTTGTVERALM